MVGRRIMKKIFIDGVCIPLFVVFALLCFPAQGQAVQPGIADILISNNSENLLLYARCVDCFKTEMESAILAGVPTVFTLQIDVCREGFMWNKTIISKEIKRTIKYDNLKKTFSIYTNGNLDAVIFPDFESAQKSMNDFNGIIASPLAALGKGNQYYLKIRVKIDKVRLPLYMEYVFFFVSYWDFETAWYNKEFFY